MAVSMALIICSTSSPDPSPSPAMSAVLPIRMSQAQPTSQHPMKMLCSRKLENQCTPKVDVDSHKLLDTQLRRQFPRGADTAVEETEIVNTCWDQI